MLLCPVRGTVPPLGHRGLVAGRLELRTPSRVAARRSYLDALRVVAIAAVVTGHWLLVDISFRDGRLAGHDALTAIPSAAPLTWLFQVMPVFFLVGGYVNAGSWLAWRDGGGGWGTWVAARARRLLRPVSVYLAAVVAGVVSASAARARPQELAQAAWLVCLHLWFLPTYLLVIALTPVLLAAHRRWGLLVPAAMAVGAAAVDVGVLSAGLPLIGFANYLLVWGSVHQWGFVWRDKASHVAPAGAALLAVGAAALFAVLVVGGAFPADLIGVRNTSPPSIALLAFAAAQAGLVVLAEPAATRVLDQGGRGRRVQRLNASAMTVYLWHMIPVVLIAVLVYPRMTVPQPVIGSTSWWALRPVWLGALAALLVPMTLAVDRLQSPLMPARLPPAPSPRGRSLLVALGIIAAGSALARLAIAGAAPDGSLAVSVVVTYAAGVLLVEAAGWLPRHGSQGW